MIRRTFLRQAALLTTAASLGACGSSSSSTTGAVSSTAVTPGPATDPLLLELDAKVEAAMRQHGIPGVGLALLWQGQEYVRGYGVTSVANPNPVDGTTLFRIASNTKIFTGTTVMRLVERGVLDLDARVQTYLPDFVTLDPSAARTVTLRQLLNHTPGWVGDNEEDTGSGDDALARLVAGLARAPQLNPPGVAFDYNNMAIDVAGRVVEVVTRQTYEQAVRNLLLQPLGLSRTQFFTPDILTRADAVTPHVPGEDGQPVPEPQAWFLPRGGHPDGGLISSAQDMLRFARFHLGDGRAADGTAVMSQATLQAMRSQPGPGGTLVVELDGMGVAWMLRPSAEGVRILQHGGAWRGQHSGFMLVPERGFALVVLTNSDTGPQLLADLFNDDWALRRFAGVSNLPAVPRPLAEAELAAYAGRYVSQGFNLQGALESNSIDLRPGPDGQLLGTFRVGVDVDVLDDPVEIGDPENGFFNFRLAFYKPDFALVLDLAGRPSGFRRINFLRGSDGRVTFIRFSGRLSQKAT